VIERSKSHIVSIRLSILLVVLGTCVFLWGMGYKLSQYDQHQRTLHRIPEAKLLSKNEDASAADSTRQVLAKAESRNQLRPVSLVVAVAAMIWTSTTSVSSFRREVDIADRVSSAMFCTALYFRPPPIHFLS